MKVLNYGSLNIDHVYQVDTIVQPGQTIASLGVNIFPGGKGMNQSIALARAGVPVYHAGNIGADGLFMKQLLPEEIRISMGLLLFLNWSVPGCSATATGRIPISSMPTAPAS